MEKPTNLKTKKPAWLGSVDDDAASYCDCHSSGGGDGDDRVGDGVSGGGGGGDVGDASNGGDCSVGCDGCGDGCGKSVGDGDGRVGDGVSGGGDGRNGGDSSGSGGVHGVNGNNGGGDGRE